MTCVVDSNFRPPAPESRRANWNRSASESSLSGPERFVPLGRRLASTDGTKHPSAAPTQQPQTLCFVFYTLRSCRQRNKWHHCSERWIIIAWVQIDSLYSWSSFFKRDSESCHCSSETNRWINLTTRAYGAINAKRAWCNQWQHLHVASWHKQWFTLSVLITPPFDWLDTYSSHSRFVDDVIFIERIFFCSSSSEGLGQDVCFCFCFTSLKLKWGILGEESQINLGFRYFIKKIFKATSELICLFSWSYLMGIEQDLVLDCFQKKKFLHKTLNSFIQV